MIFAAFAAAFRHYADSQLPSDTLTDIIFAFSMLMLMPFRLALPFSFAAIADFDTLLSLAIRHADRRHYSPRFRCSLPPLLMPFAITLREFSRCFSFYADCAFAATLYRCFIAERQFSIQPVAMAPQASAPLR
jgi:hypothetical protein